MIYNFYDYFYFLKFQGREFLITSIRDDIHKAQKRMKDLETRHHFEEYEKEKDRMQRLAFIVNFIE